MFLVLLVFLAALIATSSLFRINLLVDSFFFELLKALLAVLVTGIFCFIPIITYTSTFEVEIVSIR
jgi:hypothetical protein